MKAHLRLRHVRTATSLASTSSALLLVGWLCACASQEVGELPPNLSVEGGEGAEAPSLSLDGVPLREMDWRTLRQEWHRGPLVEVSPEGPARFARPLYEGFDVERAMDTVRFTDGFYRAPANQGYEEVIDHLRIALRRGGYGRSDPRFALEVYESAMTRPAWTPLRAELRLHAPGRNADVLHAFRDPEDVDRTMLPVHAPSCSVRGRAKLVLDELEEGDVLVTDAPLFQVIERAAAKGAAAVLSSSLATFNVDPTGAERHLDAVRFTTLRRSPDDRELPAAQISPRSHARIRAAVEQSDSVEISFEARVQLEERPLRTLVATVIGSERPHEAAVVVSHVQEPGACDNATGVGGLLEAALSLGEALREGRVEWPARSVAFVWGDEFTQSEVWLDQSGRRAVAGFSSDMTGESRERTGAIALLERMPDPGALVPLPPDEHTPWGANPVRAEDLDPNGVAVIARCAMIDVGMLVNGDWTTAEHPWEGGSDHDVFLRRGVPGVLFWHFTDFAYHTSLDRMGMVDGEELRRTSVALLCSALAVADPRPSDLARYLASLEQERALRLAAAREAENEELAQFWCQWIAGARAWLRAECLPGVEHGDVLPEPRPEEGEGGEEERDPYDCD